jgi:hypothetical protein
VQWTSGRLDAIQAATCSGNEIHRFCHIRPTLPPLTVRDCTSTAVTVAARVSCTEVASELMLGAPVGESRLLSAQQAFLRVRYEFVAQLSPLLLTLSKRQLA